MEDREAIRISKNNVPKTCKIVNGSYKGGIDNFESDMRQDIIMAVSALEERIRRKAAFDRALREVGR